MSDGRSSAYDEMLAYAQHPQADREVLAQIAMSRPDLRQVILRNPAADEPLRGWIRALPDTEATVSTTAVGDEFSDAPTLVAGQSFAPDQTTAAAPIQMPGGQGHSTPGQSAGPMQQSQPGPAWQSGQWCDAANTVPSPSAAQAFSTQAFSTEAPTKPPRRMGRLVAIAGGAVAVLVVGALVLSGVVPTPWARSSVSSAVASDATKTLGALPAGSDSYLTQPVEKWTAKVADLPADLKATAFMPNTYGQGVPGVGASALAVGDSNVLINFSTASYEHQQYGDVWSADVTKASTGVAAFDRATGEYRWSHLFSADDGTDGSAVPTCGLSVVDDVFACSTGGGMTLFDEKSGDVRARVEASDLFGHDDYRIDANGVSVDPQSSAILVVGESVAAGSGATDFTVSRLGSDGEVQWKTDHPAAGGDGRQWDSLVMRTPFGDSLMINTDGAGSFGVFAISTGELKAAGPGAALLKSENSLEYTGDGLTVNTMAQSTSAADVEQDISPTQALGVRLRDSGRGDSITAYEAQSGAKRWSATLPADQTVLTTGLDQAVAVADHDTLAARSLSDGTQLWSMSLNDGRSALETGGPLVATGNATSVTALGTYADGNGWHGASTAASEQNGVPGCADGRVLLSWSKWSDGWFTACADSDGKRPQVQMRASDGRTLSGDNLKVNDHWTRFCGSLGEADACSDFRDGMVTYHPRSGDAEMIPTQTGWFTGNGASGLGQGADVPDGVPSCEVGTSLVGWGSNGGDWVLSCGERDGRPATLRLNGFGGGDRTATDVHLQDGSICGSIAGGSICFTSTPGTLVLDTPSARSQNGVAQVWQRGQSGDGGGAYGVQAPGTTGADQARYLVDVLEKSRSARQSLQPAVTAISACGSGLSGPRSTLRVVTQNRQDLLAAISSSPVDQIDNGDGLVAQLRAALQASLDADLSYEQWADAVLSQGCGAGRSAFADANGHSQTATTAKETFTNSWNASVAPKYGLSTFGRDDI
ncbi:variant leucine-rich repeat-containing protein [Pseudoclavibacter sp. 13-3]|uniref:variant leucine-rich repeat-containing protein n=1 Tax=Pseudoclavibacter sp. 13-3 TaxID=2901228 RepID=UPI001E340E35|nr:hypothetical protein [Pseudoclavibacter sp. 13-3]MCD7101190.1 hypothetical protein [Pseudoclavibacter sp. 13-3]